MRYSKVGWNGHSGLLCCFKKDWKFTEEKTGVGGLDSSDWVIGKAEGWFGARSLVRYGWDSGFASMGGS